MGIILMVLMFIVGAYVLGIAWFIVFWLASLFGYIIAKMLSLVGIYVDVAGERNIWYLFLVVCWISYTVYTIKDSCLGYAVFVFLTGVFMLFKSADTWKISPPN